MSKTRFVKVMRSQRPEQCGEVAYSTLLLISYLQLILNPIIYAYMNNGAHWGWYWIKDYHTLFLRVSECDYPVVLNTRHISPLLWQGSWKEQKNAPMQIKFETSKFAAIFFPCITNVPVQSGQGYSSFSCSDRIINPILNSIRSQLRHTRQCCLMINQAETSAVKAKIGTRGIKVVERELRLARSLRVVKMSQTLDSALFYILYFFKKKVLYSTFTSFCQYTGSGDFISDHIIRVVRLVFVSCHILENPGSLYI